MDTKQESSDKAIRSHMMWSMGAGLIPFPLADLFTVGAVQLDLIRQLCKIYEVDFKEEEGKAIVTSLTSSLLAKIGARTAIKLIPGIGTVIGGVAMAVLSGASTYAIGHAFRTHFEKGGTILDIDLNRIKKVYQQKFEKGKEEARRYQEELEKKPTAEKSGSSSDAVDDSVQKLKDLGELLREGIITEDEFQRMKKKFIHDT
ncbi:MAG TPA: DUF697 domain-containing protein [Membranihabitans sp.]|nr:DUF697 domain-containing protein [Membranihabitans sp.]